MIKSTEGETKVRKAVSVFHRSVFFRPLRNSRGHKKAPPQDSVWVWYWAAELGLVSPTKLSSASSKSLELRVEFTAEAHVSPAMSYILDSKAKTQTRAFKCRSL